MQTFVGCEMHNKIDPSFSLCIVGKGAKQWKWIHVYSSLLECKLITLVKTCFTSKVTMFQQCLAYWVAIAIYFSCWIKALINKIPFAQTWAIVKAIYDALFLVVIGCAINQCHGYWLLSNVFASIIKLYNFLKRNWNCRQ